MILDFLLFLYWTLYNTDNSCKLTLSVRVKADLDRTIFAYDYCVQLAYIMTFDHPHAHNIVSYDIHNVSYECHVVLYREN